jgi:hypothetical protein
MEILNPGNPWRGSVSRSQFEQMTLDAQERYKFAERERRFEGEAVSRSAKVANPRSASGLYLRRHTLRP